MSRLATLQTALVLAGLSSAACSKPPAQHATAGDLVVSASIKPDPPTTGDNHLLVDVKDVAGRPVDGAQLAFEYDMAAMGSMPEMKGGGESTALGQGAYDVTYALPMNGDWSLTLDVRAPGHPAAEVRLSVSPPRRGFALERSQGGEVAASDAGSMGAGKLLDLSPRRQQLIGVTYATVEERPLSVSLRAAGRVEVDERQLADVALKYEAYVRKLYVAATGESVRQGEPLLELYSPDLLSAEEELLQVLRGGGSGSKDVIARAAERRLQLWDMSPAQIDALEARGKADGTLVIHSPASGVVLEKGAVEGTHAMPGMMLYRIGDLGRVWVQADIYEKDSAALAMGQPATMTVAALPGEALEGRVSFVAPVVDEKTRTVRARLELTNAKLLLKPGMFVDVRIQAPLGTGLAVPEQALLLSGEHRYAFVERGPGKLQAVEVKARSLGGEFDQVLSGLAKGDRVVLGAAFLVSSEAQLRSALPRWSSP
jgi:Cu(I)/Ag(I) efflux system membrane fusion protein